MFMAGMAFQIFALLLKIVLGAVALTLACLWKPQKGKMLFCAFVGIAFLIEPLLELTGYIIVSSATFRSNYAGWSTGVRNDQKLYLFVMQIVTWSKLLFYFVSSVLLVVYAAVRYRAMDSSIQVDSAADESLAVALGQRWDTHLPASKLIEIARRREWAHVIDCVPALLIFYVVFYALGSIVFDSNYYASERDFVTGLGFLSSLLFLVYLLMKDSVAGVSIGKWFTGCRVVDAASGMPASVPQTMLRNAIFVFFPLGSMIELAMVNFRSDRKRLGDQWAGTMVVHGPAQIVDGVRMKEEAGPGKAEQAPKKHPLDD